VIAWAALDVERTGLPGGTIGVKRIAVGRFVILVAGKLAAGAYADNTPCRFDAFAARRAVRIERTRKGLECGALHNRYSQDQRGNTENTHSSGPLGSPITRWEPLRLSTIFDGWYVEYD
jgi:hypothetical protein